MEANTEWFMDDEEEYLELLELYEEARDDVDRKYPRVGDSQTLMIPKFGIVRWIHGHLFMALLSRHVHGEWEERREL